MPPASGGLQRQSYSAIQRSALTAAAIVLFALGTRTYADPDLWGHLRFGLDTLRTHTLPSVDPYSFTQDREWVNHEWLSELTMALAFEAGGTGGLVVLKGLLVFGSLFLVWQALRGVDLTPRMLVVGLAALGTGSVTMTLRPQLWSLLFMCVLCRSLTKGPRVAIWTLPIAFLIWANAHGGWIVGLGTLGVWTAGKLIEDRRLGSQWATVFAVCALTTLLTPYGPVLWTFLWETVGFGRLITEWQPLMSVPLMNWLPVVAVLLLAGLLLPRTREDRLPTVFVLGLLVFSAWQVSRIAPLFVVAAIILLGPAMRRAWPQRMDAAGQRSAARAGFAPIAAAVLAVIASVAAGAGLVRAAAGCIPVVGTWVPPAGDVALLMDRAPGRVVTFFDWGQYAIWHLGPDIRVSMDGRRETVYSEARLAEHDAIVAGATAGLKALDDWRPEYVWLPGTSAETKRWLTANGYRIERDTTASFVAVRDDLPVLSASGWSSAASRCFPE